MTRKITYPTARLRDLSKDAYKVFHRGLDRDPFNENTRYRSAYLGRDAEKYVPNERDLAAVAELEEVHLASYDAKYGHFWKTRLHPLYTVAKGRGPFFAQVHLVEARHAAMVARNQSDDLLLATLVGAEWERRDNDMGWSTWRLDCPHETATDFEHDTSHVATFNVVNPLLLHARSGMEWAGTLTEAHFYPFGVDPVTVGDSDTPPGWCDGRDGDDPHPFAAYRPADRDEVKALLPSIVRITLIPIEAYEVA